MSGILDLLNSSIGKSLISGASQQLGQEKQQTTSALSAALPLILSAMKNNASTSKGAEELLGALDNSKHSGGILNDLSSILGGGEIDKDVMQDGAEILGHVFGGKEQNVASAVSKSSGMDLGSAMNILKIAAPMAMGYLGKEKRQNNVSDKNGLGNLLGGMLGSGQKEQQSLVNQLLDADGDGSIFDDIIGMILNIKTNRMKSYLLAFILIFTISGCCIDEIVESHTLNDFERSLIPYNSHQELKFEDNTGTIVIATSEPKENFVESYRLGPESCRTNEYENETNFLNFPSKNLLLKLELTAGNDTYFSLITTNKDAKNERLDLACEELFDLSIEERLTDLSINQFDFQNVLVFQNCSDSKEIERIIYSMSNGIEFIEFSDGKWLKLNE